MEAGVDVVPGTFTTHEVPLAAAWHVRKRSEGRVVGEPAGDLRHKLDRVVCALLDLYEGQRGDVVETDTQPP